MRLKERWSRVTVIDILLVITVIVLVGWLMTRLLRCEKYVTNSVPATKCLDGFEYYSLWTLYGDDILTPKFDKTDRLPKRCEAEMK